MATANILTLETLYEKFALAVTSSHTILNESLEVIPGRLSAAMHDKILTSALRILEATTADTIPNQAVVIRVRDVIHAYVAKAQIASKLTAKAGRTPRMVPAPVLQQLFDRLKALHVQVSSRDSASIPDQKVPPETALHTNADFEQTLRHACCMVTEWHLFRALELAASLVRVSQQYRAELLHLQYRLCRDANRMVILPPPSHFEAPWPILLLGHRLDRLSSDSDTDAYQALVIKILRAKTVYPQHESSIDGILLSARYDQALRAACDMIVGCTKAFAMIRERVPKNRLDPAIVHLIERLDGLKEESCSLQKDEALFALTISVTDAEKLDLLEQFEKRHTALQEKVSTYFIESLSTFRASLNEFGKFYGSLTASLHQCQESNSKSHPALPQDLSLSFTPVVPAPLFSSTSLFGPFVSHQLPSPEEIVRFSPCLYTTRIDSIIDLHRSGQQHLLSQAVEQPRESETKSPVAPRKSFRSRTHKKIIISSRYSFSQRPSVPEKAAPSPSSPPSVPSSPPYSPSFGSPLPSSPLILPPSMPVDEPSVVEKLSAISLSDEAAPSSSSFSVGSKPDPNVQFSMHVKRWWTPAHDPFLIDPAYRDRHFSQTAKESIRFQHTPPLALIRAVLDMGEKYINEDGVRESYYLPAEASWYDGSRRYDKGVVTVGRNRHTGEIFHFTFSQQAPSTLRANYSRTQFFRCTEEDVPPPQPPDKLFPQKTLPDDGSSVLQIDDQDIGIITVTIDDPKRKVRVDLFVER